MKLHEFINLNLGKVVRDGQCVALFREYIQDVWKVRPFEGLGTDGGAQDLFYRHSSLPEQSKQSDLIVYDVTINNRPQYGDAVIFSASATNQWGHVAIFLCDTSNGMLVFEQSGIAAMNKDTDRMGAKFGLWGDERLLSWLRKKE